MFKRGSEQLPCRVRISHTQLKDASVLSYVVVHLPTLIAQPAPPTPDFDANHWCPEGQVRRQALVPIGDEEACPPPDDRNGGKPVARTHRRAVHLDSGQVVLNTTERINDSLERHDGG